MEIKSMENSKSANDVLYELGYSRVVNLREGRDDCLIYQNNDGCSIYFDLKEKGVAAYSEEMRYKCNKMALLNVAELVAIEMKCRELGWL